MKTAAERPSVSFSLKGDRLAKCKNLPPFINPNKLFQAIVDEAINPELLPQEPETRVIFYIRPDQRKRIEGMPPRERRAFLDLCLDKMLEHARGEE